MTSVFFQSRNAHTIHAVSGIIPKVGDPKLLVMKKKMNIGLISVCTVKYVS